MAAEPGVVCLVDNPHPSGFEQFQDGILPDPAPFPAGKLRSRP